MVGLSSGKEHVLGLRVVAGKASRSDCSGDETGGSGSELRECSRQSECRSDHSGGLTSARERASCSALFLTPCRWSRDMTKSAGTMAIHPPSVNHHGDVVHRERNR